MLAWEATPSDRDAARSVFYTAHDDSAAVSQGYGQLVTPLVSQGRDLRGTVDYTAQEVLDLPVEPEDAALPDLLSHLQAARAEVLFTLSHGLGEAGWDETQRRALQGSLVLPREDPGQPGILRPEHAAQGAFLEGGLWFSFACFSAGTPSTSAYQHWFARMDWPSGPTLTGTLSASPHGFVAPLPKAALANPRGPLGIIGHVDLAWTHAFSFKGESHTLPYRKALKAMLRGARLGLAMRALGDALSQVHADLVTAQNTVDQLDALGVPVPPELERDLGHRWVHRQDLANFCLLGDPAVRLPLRGSSPVDQDAGVPTWAPEGPL